MTIEPQVFSEIDPTYQAYEEGRCDAVTSDRSQLVARRTAFENPDDHDMGHTDPLAEPGAADELRTQLSAPRDAAHQLYGAVTYDGARRRSKPLTAIDVSGLGRILVFLDAEDRVHRLPGTPGALVDALRATWKGL